MSKMYLPFAAFVFKNSKCVTPKTSWIPTFTLKSGRINLQGGPLPVTNEVSNPYKCPHTWVTTGVLTPLEGV